MVSGSFPGFVWRTLRCVALRQLNGARGQISQLQRLVAVLVGGRPAHLALRVRCKFVLNSGGGAVGEGKLHVPLPGGLE